MAKILIAEDEPDIRDLVGFTLRFGGHTIVMAGNGAEAVEKAKAEQPDMILMDVRMPRMTGYEACQLMKTDPLTADIPVVFLTANGQDAEIKAGLDAGAVGYLIKPFAPMELTARVAELLEKFARK